MSNLLWLCRFASRHWIWIITCTLLTVSLAQAEPWVGEPGVSETTAEIMARAAGYQRPPKLPWKTPKNRPRGRTNPENLLSDPAAPDAPAGNGPVLEAGQSTGLSFLGATLNDTLAFPPDSMGAAGPSQYIVAVNGRIRSFNKTTGLADGVLNANPDVFFSSVMTPPVDQNFTSDPRIRYDRQTGRWILIIIDVPGMAGSLPNRIMIAVSGSAVITPSTTWTFFQFQHDLVLPRSSADTGKFADYPTLGIDAHALYIGVNVFGTRGQGSFSSTTAFVVRKSSILGTGPIVVSAFRKLVGNGAQGGPYTPQGVDNPDPNPTEGYFIGVDSAYYGRLQLRRVSDPGGTPILSDDITITVPITGGTINVPHLGNTNGSNGYLDGLDYRLIAAQIRNGRLWTAANIAVDNTGSPSGTDTRMGVRWYEIGNLATGQTPALIQSGTLFQPSASNDTGQRSYWMGSVGVSGQGHMVLGFTAAGANERINAGYTGRLANDPLGSLRAPVLYTSSNSSYNPSSNPGGANGRRWGDYSYTCVDPNDDMTLWTIQEWCHAPNSYAVQVVRVLAPPPATPISATPNSLLPGQSNVVVTVTGTSVDGSGFYDPGAGFSNRISGAVSGGGVVVNSIAYQTPTTLALNVSVSPNAAAGLRQVTITNPDGQSATSAAGLLSIGATPTNLPPSITVIAPQITVEEIPFSLTVSATDPESQAITYSLDEAPPGAAINAGSGLFSWTPDESQGPATNTVTVRATDAGLPPQSTTRNFTITVLESNRPPQLAVIGNRTVHAGTTVVVTSSASDPDLPSNPLSFALLSAPFTATINPTNGIVTWQTVPADAGTTNLLKVQLADNGSPNLTDTQQFNVTVEWPPVIQSVTWHTNTALLSWSSIVGEVYTIQYKTNLNQPDWLELPATVTATNTTSQAADITADGTARYYRLRVGS